MELNGYATPDVIPRSSREAAKEYSPRRKPWVACRKIKSPERAKEAFL